MRGWMAALEAASHLHRNSEHPSAATDGPHSRSRKQQPSRGSCSNSTDTRETQLPGAFGEGFRHRLETEATPRTAAPLPGAWQVCFRAILDDCSHRSWMLHQSATRHHWDHWSRSARHCEVERPRSQLHNWQALHPSASLTSREQLPELAHPCRAQREMPCWRSRLHCDRQPLPILQQSSMRVAPGGRLREADEARRKRSCARRDSRQRRQTESRSHWAAQRHSRPGRGGCCENEDKMQTSP